MPRARVLAIVAVAFASPALAEPAFDIIVNQAQSNVSATLTVQGQSDSDTSPISGSLRIRLNAAANPTSIELHDFMLNVVNPLNFNIVYTFFGVPIGSINVNANDVAVEYGAPGIVEGPVPIASSSFAFTDVPANSSGNASYTATGTVCTLLQSQNPPQPCNGALVLDETGSQNASELPGTISIVGRTATITGSINISGPLDPANPDLGSLSISGTFVGSGQIPYCPGDFDQNGTVAVNDIFAFLSAWFAGQPSADLDGTPGVGVPDIFAFLARWFAACA